MPAAFNFPAQISVSFQIAKSGGGRQDFNKRLCGNKGYVTYKGKSRSDAWSGRVRMNPSPALSGGSHPLQHQPPGWGARLATAGAFDLRAMSAEVARERCIDWSPTRSVIHRFPVNDVLACRLAADLPSPHVARFAFLSRWRAARRWSVLNRASSRPQLGSRPSFVAALLEPLIKSGLCGTQANVRRRLSWLWWRGTGCITESVHSWTCPVNANSVATVQLTKILLFQRTSRDWRKRKLCKQESFLGILGFHSTNSFYSCGQTIIEKLSFVKFLIKLEINWLLFIWSGYRRSQIHRALLESN